jgi:hypothetical protein
MEDLKRRAKEAVRLFGIEFVIAQKQDQITQQVLAYTRNIIPKDVIMWINENKAFPVEKELVELAKEHTAILESYKVVNVAQIFLEQMQLARPDIFTAILAMGNDGATWVMNNCQMFYDAVTHPEQPTPEIVRPHKVSLTCDACRGEIVVDSDKIINLKTCPFCGVGVKEKKEEPPVTPPSE